jgi:hypothetical protein
VQYLQIDHCPLPSKCLPAHHSWPSSNLVQPLRLKYNHEIAQELGLIKISSDCDSESQCIAQQTVMCHHFLPCSSLRGPDCLFKFARSWDQSVEHPKYWCADIRRHTPQTPCSHCIGHIAIHIPLTISLTLYWKVHRRNYKSALRNPILSHQKLVKASTT